VLRFYWRLVKRTPLLLWRALTGLDKVIGALTLAFGVVGLGAWQQLLPWWLPFVAFGVLLYYGFLRENYEEYLAVEGERDTLKESVETDEKRAVIGEGLQQLYGQGAELRIEVMNSTDETPASECDEKLTMWRQSVIGYLMENASTGKAQYVDGVTSVSAATITGMKSETTRREKETIVLHLNERLKRLADVMREY
jgi:hypothetical protein